MTPKFFELLTEAHHASQDVDMFDLHSEDAESAKAWQALLLAQDTAARELIIYCMENGESLRSEFIDCERQSKLEEARSADEVSATTPTSQPDTYDKKARDLMSQLDGCCYSEECAVIASVLRSSVSEAVAEEREACEAIAHVVSTDHCQEGELWVAAKIAAEIRSRGEAR